jgi:lipid A 3-O-deacylase
MREPPRDGGFRLRGDNVKSWKGVLPIAAAVFCGMGCVPARAQQTVSMPEMSAHRTWEYGALLQGGNGLQDRTGFQFLMVGGHLGRVLTSDSGPGLLHGNFEYAVEVFPLWQSYTPKFLRISCAAYIHDPACSQPYTVGGTYTGASITPIMLRWNFVHSGRLMPWVQAAGGVLWTNHKYPAVGDLNAGDPTQTGPNSDTSVWNFTPQGGIGGHYFLEPKRSLDFSVNGVHISSASLGDKNPGVNSSVQVSVGYTWWK